MSASEPVQIDSSVSDVPVETARTLGRFLCGATLVMVALSWRLWFDQADFPAIPFIRWWPSLPLTWSPASLLLLAIALAGGAWRPTQRVGLFSALAIFFVLILADQLRLQAWVYHFLVVGALLAFLPAREALLLSRAFMILTYIHSGLSKFDFSFVHELGPRFAQAFSRVTNRDIGAFATADDGLLLYVAPLAEILAAILLIWRRTRIVGLILAIVMHLILITILSPWGLAHSAIVLLWNAVFCVEDVLLFGVGQRRSQIAERTAFSRAGRVGVVGVAIVAVLPLTERLGWFDAWPSHALYASHCERGWITFWGIQGQEVPPNYPDEFRRYVQGFTEGIDYLDLYDWFRDRRGVPPYPQNRYLTGVAEWVAQRFATTPERGVSLILQSAAHPLTGERTEVKFNSPEEIRDQASRYRLNAHPRSISR